MVFLDRFLGIVLVAANSGSHRVRRVAACSAIPLGLVALQACGSSETRGVDETTGTSKQAVGDGVRDHANSLPFVGKLRIPNSTGGTCSAVLITPLWVATSNHCFTGSKESWSCLGGAYASAIPSYALDMTIDFAASSTEFGAVGVHTFGNSGEVVLRTKQETNLCDNEGAASDVALIKLDTRIPLSAVRPKHPPINGVTRCDVFLRNGGQGDDEDDNDFEGKLVGFGNIGSDVLTPGDPVNYRSWRTSANWDREDVGGFVYRNSWKFLFSTYTGILPGDSGGALLTTGGGELLCGINSRFYPDLDGLGVGASAAALDSPDNLKFLNDHVLTRGLSRLNGFTDGTHFTGECEKSCIDPDTDTDNDGWPDCCDNCIRDVNINQVDTDGDGVGEACDLCPGVVARDQGPNCNLEAELGTHFGQGEQPPPGTPTLALLDKIIPDACDPTPCAQFNTVDGPVAVNPDGRTYGEQNTLPPGVFIQAGLAPPGQASLCALGIFDCVVGVDTQIDVGAKAGIIPASGAQAGTYTFQHCACDAARATDCHGAPWYCFAGEQTGSPSGWRKIPVRAANETWTQAKARYASGLEAITTSVFTPSHDFDDARLFFDFTVLPYATGLTPGASDYGQPAVRGILRSRVENHPSATVKGVGVAQVYNSGTTSTSIHTRPSPSFKEKFSNRDLFTAGRIPWPCGQLEVRCPPSGIGDYINIKGNPALNNVVFGMVVSRTGWSVANGQPGVTEPLLSAMNRVASGTERLIVAAEPPSRLSARGAPIRAALLDANSRISTLLGARTGGGYDAFDLCDGPCQQTLQNSASAPSQNSATVLNAEHARFFSFGDGQDRVVQEQLTSEAPGSTARTEFPLRFGFRPAKVLAATWDMDGNALYAFDQTLLVSQLRRWQYGADRFETISISPNTFGVFDQQWLVFGTDGDLIHVATKRGGVLSVLVRFTIDVSTQRVRFAGVKLLTQEIVTQPIAVRDSVQVLVPDTQHGFRYQMLPFTDFSFSNLAWHPLMRP